MNKITVYVDSLEHNEHPDISLELSDTFNIIIQRLPTGDYMSGNIIIEYKTLRNFISDIQSEHIFQQAQDMSVNSEYQSYILISGSINDLWRYGLGISTNAVSGAVASLTVRWNIPVMFLGSKLNTVKTMTYMFQKAHDNKPAYIFPVRKKITYDDYYINYLQSLPGVGEKTAAALKKLFTTPKHLCNATYTELSKAIGKKKAEKIYRFFHGDINK